jgi:hypothetical protein
MMFSRSIVAAALAFSAAVVLAQDDVVPADKEPRHVPKLVNEWVRIVDVEIPEGEQTLYHRHSLDYPYVLVTSVTLFNQIYGQDPKDVKMEAGFVGYYNAASKGAYTHRFINRGPGAFRAIGIELLKPMQVSPAVPPRLPTLVDAEIVLDNERVGAYRIKLEPGASTGPLSIPGPSIRVAMGEGRIVDKSADGDVTTDLLPAKFLFREQAVETTLTNIGDKPVELVEFVLKK